MSTEERIRRLAAALDEPMFTERDRLRAASIRALADLPFGMPPPAVMEAARCVWARPAAAPPADPTKPELAELLADAESHLAERREAFAEVRGAMLHVLTVASTAGDGSSTTATHDTLMGHLRRQTGIDGAERLVAAIKRIGGNC